jgi:hypothetical protein
MLTTLCETTEGLYIRGRNIYNLTMDKRIHLIILGIIILAFSPSEPQATGAIYTGIPFVTDSSRDMWYNGKMIGVKAYRPLTDNFMLGGQFGIYHWAGSYERMLFVVEAYPTVRIINVLPKLAGMDLSIQIGVGATFIHGDGGIAYAVPTCSGCSSVDPDGPDNLGDLWAFGFNAGIGLNLFNVGSVRFEIIPMYHYGYAGDQRNAFASVNLVVFGGK